MAKKKYGAYQARLPKTARAELTDEAKKARK
jgi:hypothetical protein